MYPFIEDGYRFSRGIQGVKPKVIRLPFIRKLDRSFFNFTYCPKGRPFVSQALTFA